VNSPEEQLGRDLIVMAMPDVLAGYSKNIAVKL
jgi:hypothetical protein